MTQVSLSRQIQAVERAHRIVGGAPAPARHSERELVLADLLAAVRSLQWLQSNEQTIRDAVARASERRTGE